MANTTATVQQKFSASILAKLAELKEGNLKKLGELGSAKGGESFTFYRVAEGKAKDGVPSMLPGGTGASNADGGDMTSYKATIGQISSQDKVKKVDMLKTQLDIKSPIVASMTRAVIKKEDEKILDAIKANGSVATGGSASLDLGTIEGARELIAIVRGAFVGAEKTPDGKKGVALVISRKDYQRLASSDAFIHGDYRDSIRGGSNDLPLSMEGAEIVISSLVAEGEIFVIPSNTFGYAEWENSTDVDVIYMANDGQTYHLQVVKSVGVAIIEPEFITKFTCKPSSTIKSK